MAEGGTMGQGTQSFEDFALRQGLITPEQLEECRRIQQKVVADGLECELEEVLIKKGLVTKSQAVAIHAAMGRGNRTAIEGYEILGKLGEGGMGAVYKAKQSSMDRLVAIKVLLPKFLKEKDGVERFLREARAIARLNHPNIVSGIDAGYSNGIYYYVMEYLDGEALDRRLSRTGPIPWREAVTIVRQVAEALNHAHKNGLIHRDIKPGNILIAKSGTVKLADLGMARFSADQETTLTQTGLIVGTPRYMSPEQARGERELDIRADLYALGITLYEMLKGEPPFLSNDPLVVLNQHLKEPVRFAFDIPPGLLAIGHRLTEKDRARRYANPAQLIEDLDALEKDKPLPHAKNVVRPKTARIPVLKPAKSRTPIFVGVALAVVLAVGALIALSNRSEPTKEKEPAAKVSETPRKPAITDKDLEEEKPLTEADKAALEKFKAARAYELNNPDDVEEIAAQYAALSGQTGGTAYAKRAESRAEDTKKALFAAIEKRQNLVAGELDSKKHGAALAVLEKHARDFKSQSWKDWIDKQQLETEARIGADAKALRRKSSDAEARGDFSAAIDAMKELDGFGVPPLSKEASDSIARLEKAEKTAQNEKLRLAGLDESRVSEFLDQAEKLAGQRNYDKLASDAPKVESDSAQATLRNHLEFFAQAGEVFDAARKHAMALRGQSVRFETKSGAKFSGTVEEAQPGVLLVGGKNLQVNEVNTPGIVQLYRAARGAAAKPECILAFAILDGDGALADETLKKNPIELLPRFRALLDNLRARQQAEAAKAQVERDAESLFRAAERAKKEEQASKFAEVIDKYPDSKWAEQAKKKLEGLGKDAREIVVYATDLPHDAYVSDWSIRDDSSSGIGKILFTKQDGDPQPLPPGNQEQVTLKVAVQAGVAYRCWVHMKVVPHSDKSKSRGNLLFVQFSGGSDKSGKDLFALGSGNHLALRGPEKEGWVWVGKDMADAKSAEPILYFRKGAEVTIHVFEGVDGVCFDQLVLSPAKYFDKAPTEAVVSKPKK